MPICKDHAEQAQHRCDRCQAWMPVTHLRCKRCEATTIVEEMERQGVDPRLVQRAHELAQRL